MQAGNERKCKSATRHEETTIDLAHVESIIVKTFQYTVDIKPLNLFWSSK